MGGAGAGALGDAFGDPVAFAVLGGVSLAVAALLARPRVDGALRAKEAST